MMRTEPIDTDINPELIGDYDDNELTRWIETDTTFEELSPEGQKQVLDYVKEKRKIDE